ncbi:MAG: hypothetical protein HC804_10855 [Anaerolineae bacterium]|nr:hypothetical protein [Anaerolineae bacterium]
MVNRTYETNLESAQVDTAVPTIQQPASPQLTVGLGRGVAGDTAVLQRMTNGRLPRAGNALLQLQRSHGNGHVQRLVVQAKMLLGPADDPYEREADQAARQVAQGQAHLVQRQVTGEGGTAVLLKLNLLSIVPEVADGRCPDPCSSR